MLPGSPSPFCLWLHTRRAPPAEAPLSWPTVGFWSWDCPSPAPASLGSGPSALTGPVQDQKKQKKKKKSQLYLSSKPVHRVDNGPWIIIIMLLCRAVALFTAYMLWLAVFLAFYDVIIDSMLLCKLIIDSTTVLILRPCKMGPFVFFVLIHNIKLCI